MDRNSIITLPHESLRQKSSRVTAFDDATRATIADMKQAGLDWEAHRQHEICVGLAAVQVNILKRIVIIRDNQEDKRDTSFVTMINPKIIRRSGTPELDYEGCLSVKEIYGQVPRSPRVTVEAQDENGDTFRVKAEGFLARLIQHEVDHTHGTVFIDHIKDQDNFYAINDEGKIQPVELATIQESQELWT